MKFLPIATVMLGMTTAIVTQSANAELRPSPQKFSVPLTAVAETVVSTLAARGIQVSADQVKLPVDVLATEESPLLEVGSIGKLGRLNGSQQGQMSASVRLKCKLASACRPFFAIATWQEDSQDQVAPALAKTAAVTQIIAKTKAEGATLNAGQSTAIIKAGQPLTLLIDADQMHIQMAVVSLAGASLGQKIRVSTPDHKHFYMAEVLDAGTVKGSI